MSKTIYICKGCAIPCTIDLHNSNPNVAPKNCAVNWYNKCSWTLCEEKAPTSEMEEARGMQSGPAAQGLKSPHALNAFAPDCLSGLMSALRTYAEQSQPEMSATMTFAKGELSIRVWKA